MTLFLTGVRQVGKSTALRKALAASGLRFGGVMTRFDARHGERRLYLLPYAVSEALPEGIPESAVCARMGAGGRRADPTVFNTLGATLLRKAMADEAVDILVIDELGFLEAEAEGFRAAVYEALQGPKPVLGVVREGLGAWGGAPLGELIEVTEGNRDRVPGEILDWLK